MHVIVYSDLCFKLWMDGHLFVGWLDWSTQAGVRQKSQVREVNAEVEPQMQTFTDFRRTHFHTSVLISIYLLYVGDILWIEMVKKSLGYCLICLRESRSRVQLLL